MKIRSIYWFLLSCVWGALPLFAQLDRAGPPSTRSRLAQNAARVAAGEASFQQLCTGCHGRGGEGGQGEGQGPNLATNWEVRRANDQTLFNYIKNGVKGTAMPAFSLPEERIWELAAFVRSLNAPADSVPTPGDPSAGRALFFGKGGCSACHMVKGRGGYLGPDLSDIGATRRLNELRDALLKPSPAASSGFQPLLLRDAHGRQLRAIAKHSSPWSVQVLDENGKLHLIHGDAVKDLKFQKQSWMPLDIAQRFSPTEINNLLAFLSRQAITQEKGAVP
jgi:putative heme-binding domain-containing protein